MSDLDDEVAQLLDEAVARLSTTCRTFTGEEALLPIWERGYDFSPQSDPQGRFVLAAEQTASVLASGGSLPRHSPITGCWMRCDPGRGMGRTSTPNWPGSTPKTRCITRSAPTMRVSPSF